MIKIQKIANDLVLDFGIGLSVFGFVSNFDIRISGFALLAGMGR